MTCDSRSSGCPTDRSTCGQFHFRGLPHLSSLGCAKQDGCASNRRLNNVPPAQRPTVSWEKIVEHIDHAAKLVGAAHVGLGSDFDGTTVPDGMDDVSMLPKITAALLEKGYSEQDVKNVLGENILRLLERVDTIGKQIRAGK